MAVTFCCPHIFFFYFIVLVYILVDIHLRPVYVCYFPGGFVSCRSCVCFTSTAREEPGVSWALLSSSIGRYTNTALNTHYVSGPEPYGLLIIISKLKALSPGIFSLSSSHRPLFFITMQYRGRVSSNGNTSYR